MYEVQVLIKNLDTGKKFGGKVPVEQREALMQTLVEIAATIGAVLETRGDL